MSFSKFERTNANILKSENTDKKYNASDILDIISGLILDANDLNYNRKIVNNPEEAVGYLRNVNMVLNSILTIYDENKPNITDVRESLKNLAESVTEKAKDYEKESSDLVREIEKGTAIKKDLEAKLKVLEEKRGYLRDIDENSKSIEKEIEYLSSTHLDELEKEYDALKIKHKELKSKEKELEEGIFELKNEITLTDKNVAELLRESDMLERKKNDSSELSKSLLIQVSLYKDTLSKLENEINDAQEWLDNNESVISERKETLSELENKLNVFIQMWNRINKPKFKLFEKNKKTKDVLEIKEYKEIDEYFSDKRVQVETILSDYENRLTELVKLSEQAFEKEN